MCSRWACMFAWNGGAGRTSRDACLHPRLQRAGSDCGGPAAADLTVTAPPCCRAIPTPFPCTFALQTWVQCIVFIAIGLSPWFAALPASPPTRLPLPRLPALACCAHPHLPSSCLIPLPPRSLPPPADHHQERDGLSGERGRRHTLRQPHLPRRRLRLAEVLGRAGFQRHRWGGGWLVGARPLEEAVGPAARCVVAQQQAGQPEFTGGPALPCSLPEFPSLTQTPAPSAQPLPSSALPAPPAPQAHSLPRPPAPPCRRHQRPCGVAV